MSEPDIVPLDTETLLRRQESLHLIIESISSELDLRPLLTRIVRHACELLQADRGTIGLVDEERQLVRTEAAYRMPPGEIGSEMPPGIGLAGYVLQTRQPLVLNQYGTLERPLQLSLIEDAVIGLPIFWRERMIGFFGIGAEPPRTFTQEDVELLTLLARHAAIAIENARLFAAERQRTAHRTALNHIGKLISGNLDPTQLLQTAVTAINQYLHHANIAVLLLDEEDPHNLILTAHSGIYTQAHPPAYRASIDEGIVGAAARGRHALLIPDVSQDPRYVPIPGVNDICSELAIPIIVRNQLIGVLNIESRSLLTEDDQTELEIVADQLGIAIINARLFSQTQQALTETQLLYQTSRRISAAISIDQVIQIYLEQVARQNRYICNVALYQFDEADQRTAVVVRGRWSPQDGIVITPLTFPYEYDQLDDILDTGQTVTISNVHTDPRVSTSLRRLQAQVNRPALTMIPLIVRNKRIGLVILSYPTVYHWPEAELWPYQVTAAQLATAIHTRRQQSLLAQNAQELAVLRERQHLARELHDSVTQLIFSMTLIAQSIAPAWQRDPAQGQQRTQRLVELSQNALAEMRALLFELRAAEPALLGEDSDPTYNSGIARVRRLGLVQALQAHLDDISTEGLTIRFNAPTYRPQSIEQEIALFRITQEALNNISKHAQAQLVIIELQANVDTISLNIADDGLGFQPPPDNTVLPGRFGLRTMRERAEALNGTLQLISTPGHGTIVRVNLPT